jgi:hypothetical protein
MGEMNYSGANDVVTLTVGSGFPYGKPQFLLGAVLFF